MISLRVCAVRSFEAVLSMIANAIGMNFAARVCGQRVSVSRD
jgi:hypothetical protein